MKKLESYSAADEELAWQLQAQENLQVDDLSAVISDNVAAESSSSAPAESSSTPSIPVQVRNEDDGIEPDNMTYEELQALGEAAGSESRGLSEDLISYLKHFKYKRSCGSRGKETEDCVICKSTYKHKETLIELPCSHSYHAECIGHWLKICRACPVCKEEVFG